MLCLDEGPQCTKELYIQLLFKIHYKNTTVELLRHYKNTTKTLLITTKTLNKWLQMFCIQSFSNPSKFCSAFLTNLTQVPWDVKVRHPNTYKCQMCRWFLKFQERAPVQWQSPNTQSLFFFFWRILVQKWFWLLYNAFFRFPSFDDYDSAQQPVCI